MPPSEVPDRSHMTSIVIAAHNEESVIDRCLDALSSQQNAGDLDIIVAANGCTDHTADVARRWSVRVIETERAGKAAALNLADKLAAGYPRIYLDADIVLDPQAIGRLVAALADDPRCCAAVPTRELDVTGRPLIVKGYTAISSRLPAFRDGLFGRGVIALSQRGRLRFDSFPELIADDLFLDSLFTHAGEGPRGHREGPGRDTAAHSRPPPSTCQSSARQCRAPFGQPRGTDTGLGESRGPIRLAQ